MQACGLQSLVLIPAMHTSELSGRQNQCRGLNGKARGSSKGADGDSDGSGHKLVAPARGFDRALPSLTARNCTAVEGCLSAKWLSSDHPPWTCHAVTRNRDEFRSSLRPGQI